MDRETGISFSVQENCPKIRTEKRNVKGKRLLFEIMITIVEYVR
jgi:hypothetical protein